MSQMADQFGNPLTIRQLAEAYGYRPEVYGIVSSSELGPVLQELEIDARLTKEAEARAVQEEQLAQAIPRRSATGICAKKMHGDLASLQESPKEKI